MTPHYIRQLIVVKCQITYYYFLQKKKKMANFEEALAPVGDFSFKLKIRIIPLIMFF